MYINGLHYDGKVVDFPIEVGRKTFWKFVRNCVKCWQINDSLTIEKESHLDNFSVYNGKELIACFGEYKAAKQFCELDKQIQFNYLAGRRPYRAKRLLKINYFANCVLPSEVTNETL